MIQRVHSRDFGAGAQRCFAHRKPSRLRELPQRNARSGRGIELPSGNTLDLDAQGVVGFQFRFGLGTFYRTEQNALLFVFGFPSGRVRDFEIEIAAPRLAWEFFTVIAYRFGSYKTALSSLSLLRH